MFYRVKRAIHLVAWRQMRLLVPKLKSHHLWRVVSTPEQKIHRHQPRHMAHQQKSNRPLFQIVKLPDLHQLARSLQPCQYSATLNFFALFVWIPAQHL